MLVAVEAESVAQAVGKEVVSRAVAGTSDHGARAIVHSTGKVPVAGSVECCILGFAYNFVDTRDFLRWLAEFAGSGHVRFVAFPLASSIDQDDVTFAQLLWFQCPVRQRRRCAQENQRAALQTHIREAAFDKMDNVVLRHAFLEGSEDSAEDVEGGVAGQTHEFKLMRRLPPAAGNGDRIGGDVFERWSSLSQVVEEGEPDGFFHADSAGADAAVGEGSCGEFCRAFVLLPCANFERQLKLFAKAAFLDGGDNEHRIAGAGYEQAEQ